MIQACQDNTFASFRSNLSSFICTMAGAIRKRVDVYANCSTCLFIHHLLFRMLTTISLSVLSVS